MPEEKKNKAASRAPKAAKAPAARKTDAKKAVDSKKEEKQNVTTLPREAGPAAKKAEKRRQKLLKKQNQKKHGTGFWVIWIIVAFCVGVFGGKFVLDNVFGLFVPMGTVTGKTALTEAQLDSVVATFTGDGETVSVTAREVLEHTSGLENAKDGSTYGFPTANDVLEYVQNTVMNNEVAKQGITVSDDEAKQYAEDTFESSDYDALATQYGMSVDDVKQVIKDAAGVRKLYEQVTGQSASDTVVAPEEPSDGNKDQATEGYGQYVTHLLGDEWNTEKETWASTDGKYYSELKDETFSSTSATYNQAKKAYDVATKDASTDTKDASETWSKYVNELMAKVSVVIGEIL